MSLVINKMKLDQSSQQLLLVDGPDRKVNVLNIETLKEVC